MILSQVMPRAKSFSVASLIQTFRSFTSLIYSLRFLKPLPFADLCPPATRLGTDKINWLLNISMFRRTHKSKCSNDRNIRREKLKTNWPNYIGAGGGMQTRNLRTFCPRLILKIFSFLVFYSKSITPV